MDENELILKYNKIFYNSKFRSYLTGKIGYCPSGLTMHIENKNGNIKLIPTIKKYGFESSYNNGINGDLWDCEMKTTGITPDMIKYMNEYLNTND